MFKKIVQVLTAIGLASEPSAVKNTELQQNPAPLTTTEKSGAGSLNAESVRAALRTNHDPSADVTCKPTDFTREEAKEVQGQLSHLKQRTKSFYEKFLVENLGKKDTHGQIDESEVPFDTAFKTFITAPNGEKLGVYIKSGPIIEIGPEDIVTGDIDDENKLVLDLYHLSDAIQRSFAEAPLVEKVSEPFAPDTSQEILERSASDLATQARKSGGVHALGSAQTRLLGGQFDNVVDYYFSGNGYAAPGKDLSKIFAAFNLNPEDRGIEKLQKIIEVLMAQLHT